jgi:hypothetical protein
VNAESLRLEHFDREVAQRHPVARQNFTAESRSDEAADRLFFGLTDIDVETVGEIFEEVVTQSR